ncbi:MAG: hypothetical protein AB1553_14915 [Nitrospirota bacterium]
MSDFKYKQYSDEEDKIYNAAMEKIRQGMENGLSFNEACSTINVKDHELRDFIVDDALKIKIAELHFQKGLLLPAVAETLKIPLAKIQTAYREMLEDVGNTAADMYLMNNPDGPVGNA